jgi:septum formation protein
MVAVSHSPAPRLILASASPRRADLLTAAGISFEVCAADVDENPLPAEAPRTYVRRIAEAKARAIPRRLGCAVLAADTVVLVEEQMLGKPEDAGDARRMLRLLSGRGHQVMTGVALIGPPSRAALEGPLHTRVEVTTVEFARLSDAEIEWYVASGEPSDKAGAYAIQGLASRFVTRIDGSYTNVVGLPIPLVCQMCREAGILLS